MLYTYKKNKVEDAFYFRNYLFKTQDSLSPQFSQPGVFKSHQMEAAYNFHFTLGSNNFTQTTQIGVLKTAEENISQHITRTDAIGRLAILWKKRKGRTNHEANLSWDRSPLSLPEMNSRLFPQKPTIFTIHKIKDNAVTNRIHGMYSSRKMFKNGRSLSTIFSAHLQANSGLYRNSYDRFLQISIDSITNRITHSVFASLYYNFNIKPIDASVYLNAGYNMNEQLVLLNDHIHKTSSHTFNLDVEVNKYFNRKHIFEFNNKLRYFFVDYPASLENAGPTSNYFQAWLGLNYEYRVNIKWSLFLDNKLLGEDLFSAQPRSLFFVNSSAQFSPQKSKFRFTLSLENITNLRRFQNIQASQFYFSQTHIPLISRNLQFRVYYGL